MKDDRLRVTLDNAYAESLGRALFAFARLEWDAAWCCEKIQVDYLKNLRTKTAGNIADNLIRLVQTRSSVWVTHESVCREFRNMVKLRNRLMHAKPGSNAKFEQRLFDKGTEFDISLVDDAADQFTACQILMSDMLHFKL